MSRRTSHFMENHSNRPYGVGYDDTLLICLPHNFTSNPCDSSVPTDTGNCQLCLSFCRVRPHMGRTRVQAAEAGKPLQGPTGR